MIQVGVVKVADLSQTFYGEIRPITGNYDPEALKVVGVTREQTMAYPDSLETIPLLRQFILDTNDHGRPIFTSDNLAFDWAFVNYYFYMLYRNQENPNPFGWSGRRIGDIFSGLVGEATKPWKRKLRKTPHDHNPVNDAMGNAEALLYMRDEMGFKVNF